MKFPLAQAIQRLRQDCLLHYLLDRVGSYKWVLWLGSLLFLERRYRRPYCGFQLHYFFLSCPPLLPRSFAFIGDHKMRRGRLAWCTWLWLKMPQKSQKLNAFYSLSLPPIWQSQQLSGWPRSDSPGFPDLQSVEPDQDTVCRSDLLFDARCLDVMLSRAAFL